MGEDLVFENNAEVQTILAAIMGRYNEIAQALNGDPEDFAPIYWESVKDGTVIAGDRAEGFLEAIELQADAWLPLIRDKEAGILLMPILALCGDAAGTPSFPRCGDGCCIVRRGARNDPDLRVRDSTILARTAGLIFSHAKRAKSRPQ